MALLRPFRALRPIPEKAREVAAVPYDVVNRDEAAELARGNPLSFLHVSRPEIDLPAGTDPYSPDVYRRAKSNFESLIRSAPLVTDDESKLYIYRLRQGAHQQTGIAATFSIDEYDSGAIKKHELTRKDKEDDRTRHVDTLSSQTGPVFLTYRGLIPITTIVEGATARKPLYDFVAPDGVTHQIWAADTAEIRALVADFTKVPALYIADGHHRAASAARVRAERRKRNPAHTGNEAYNFMMAVAFPAEELRILPYHRIIKDLNGQTELLKKLEPAFEIARAAGPDPARGNFAMYWDGQWLELRPKRRPDAKDVIGSLDVSILQKQVLEPLFGIQDPRTDKRIDFVGGIRGTKELEKLVDSGTAKVAFSLHPTTLDDLLNVADAGKIMPPKSTWFEPKLRDGLLSHGI